MKKYSFEIKYNDITFLNADGELISDNLFKRLEDLFKSVNVSLPIGFKNFC